jgi:hypothetical protein
LPAKAQSWTTQDSTKTDGAQRLERIEYVVGASLAFSLFDYVGYNLVRTNSSSPSWYRLLEGTVQTAISYFLYKECGLSSVISFNLIWWTWGDDMAYYGWTNLLNPASPNRLNPDSDWENRTNSGLKIRDIGWAGWTPIGLTRPQGSNIARSTLIAQAVIGLSVSIGILW